MDPNSNIATNDDDDDKCYTYWVLNTFYTMCWALHILFVYLMLIQNNFIIWLLLLSHLTGEKNDAKGGYVILARICLLHSF